MRITKVTTRNGDGGKTNLAKGESVLKSDNIIHCLGEVDELSSVIGVCLSFSQNSDISEFLKKILGQEVIVTRIWFSKKN